MRNVLIYDHDKDYIEHLMHQLSMQCVKDYLFTACSTIACLESYIKNNAHWDVVICDIHDRDLKSLISCVNLTIPLVEHYSDSTKVGLLKYQNVERFIDQLNDLFGVKSNVNEKEDSTQITLVVSAEGGSGKSTLASALAKWKSDKYETLLLSFEVYSDIASMLETSVSKSMTDLFYYIKRQDVGWLKGFQNQLVKDDYLEFTVATPFCSAKDMTELTKADLDIFFTTLLEVCAYRRVIIDTAHATDQLFIKLLEYVDVVWVIEGKGPFSDSRNKKLLDDLNKIEHTEALMIRHIKNAPFFEARDSADLVKFDRLPFDQQVRSSFRAKAFSLSGMPYYKALSGFIESRA